MQRQFNEQNSLEIILIFVIDFVLYCFWLFEFIQLLNSKIPKNN